MSKLKEWAMEVGAAEILPIRPYRMEANWPGTDSDPYLLLPQVKTMLLLVFPYQTFAWKAEEAQANAFYPAFQRGREAALLLAERLKAAGYEAVNAPNLPLKSMAAKTGLLQYGRNSLIGTEKYGTRITLQCVLTDFETDTVESGREYSLAESCIGCAACVKACPTGAILGDGRLAAERCLRNLPYNEVIPQEFREKLGASLYGCDRCQSVCPRNAAQEACEPPQELRDALRLERLLNGEYKALKPFLGANYARRSRVMGRAALIAGNIGGRELLPLLEAIAQNEESPMREHAAWAIRKIK